MRLIYIRKFNFGKCVGCIQVYSRYCHSTCIAVAYGLLLLGMNSSWFWPWPQANVWGMHTFESGCLAGMGPFVCVCVMAHDPSITILPGSQEWLPLQFVWMFVRKPLEQSENPLFFVLYDGVMYEWINPLLSIVPNSLDTFFWQV